MKLRIKYNCKSSWLGRLILGKKHRGIVLWPFVLFRDHADDVDATLFRHEMEHVYQVLRSGIFVFYFRYLWYHFRYGYDANPYEIEAKTAEKHLLSVAEQRFKDKN